MVQEGTEGARRVGRMKNCTISRKEFQEFQGQVIVLMGVVSVLARIMVQAYEKTPLLNKKEGEFILDSLVSFREYIEAMKEENINEKTQ